MIPGVESTSARLILFRICVAAAAIALIAFVFVAHGLWLPPNHDDSAGIVEAHKLLAGCYNDIMEINPPLIVFLTEPGVLLSKATGLSACYEADQGRSYGQLALLLVDQI
jgi:hypothetical protein